MWILATWGAIMPSLRKNCPADDPRTIQVRVRRIKDAMYFREHYLTHTQDSAAVIVTNAGTDYDGRMYIRPQSLAESLALMALDIDYTSFKDQTEIKHKDKQLHTAYYRVWNALYDVLSTRKAFSPKAYINPRRFGKTSAQERIAETVYRTEKREWRMSGASPETLANLMREIDEATEGVELPSDAELAATAAQFWTDAGEHAGPTEVNGHLDHSNCAHDSTRSARKKCRKRFYGHI
jgi:hypothetical protein